MQPLFHEKVVARNHDLLTQEMQIGGATHNPFGSCVALP